MKSSFDKLIESDKPVLIDFFAEWCGPCKALAPILKEVSKDVGDTARIVKVDIDKNQALANKLNIRGVPHLMLYKNGEVLWTGSGVRTQHELTSVIKKHL